MALGRKTGGRQKGTPNKATKDIRAAFQKLVEDLEPDLKKWIRATAKRSPGYAVNLVAELASFCVPKPQRLEVAGDASQPVVVEIHKDSQQTKE